MSIIEMFRTANIYIAQSISKDNLNSQLSLASRMNVLCLILGQKEVLENSIMVGGIWARVPKNPFPWKRSWKL